MKNLDTYLGLCTEFYDLDKPEVPAEELSFYKEYAKQAQGPILEPMCGTGRMFIPLMEEGFDMHGFDASLYMLEALYRKSKIKNIPPKVWQGFLQELDQPERYSLIIIPCGSFSLISKEDEIKLCLQKIYEHLTDDGIFVFQAENMASIPAELGIWKGSVQKREDDKLIIHSYFDLPLKDNVGESIHKYQLIDSNNTVKTEIEYFKVRLYEPEQLFDQLYEIGFRHIRILNSFDHNPNPDQITIFECSK